MSDVVKTERTDHVMQIVLNRPESLNAMNIPLIEGLSRALDQARDPDVRAVLIRGDGRGFCAGGDISFFAETLKSGQGVPREMPERLHDMIEILCGLPKPVIASVHGPCAGAGMSLVLACDLALAAEDAKFNMAYVGIGLSPDGSSTYFLPRHVGYKKAMEIFTMPRNLEAPEALELGIINRIVPTDDLLQESLTMAKKLASGPTTAFASIKQLLSESFRNDLHDQLQLESDLVCVSGQTEDFQAGIMAFLEKKRPQFTGK
jgi:2-(1,2-epoxy-1,2-dihydrophenyl)acetyl-CoA isomerase